MRPVEQSMHQALFLEDEEEVKVEYENYERFSNAKTCLREYLNKQWDFSDYFNKNDGYVLMGGLLSGIVMVLFTMFSYYAGGVITALGFALPIIFAAWRWLIMVRENSTNHIGCVWPFIVGFFVLIGGGNVRVRSLPCVEEPSLGIQIIHAARSTIIKMTKQNRSGINC